MRGVFFWEYTLISTGENKRQNDMDDEKSRQDKLLTIQKLMQSGDFKTALIQLDELLDVDPLFADALYMKAACCLLYTSPSPRDKRQSRMPSSA